MTEFQLFSAERVSDRQRDLLAAAEAAQLRRTARGTPHRLRSGAVVLVRALQPSDGRLLVDAFARLSETSRRRRFLTGKTALTAADLRRLTDVDHRDREALVAVEPHNGRAVGIARFARQTDDPLSAEVAVTVVDDWHRRGVATSLLAQLVARAREVGIYSFTALVSAENHATIGLLSPLRPGVEVTRLDGEVIEYQIGLSAYADLVGSRDG